MPKPQSAISTGVEVMMRFIVPNATKPVTAAATKAGRAMISRTGAPPALPAMVVLDWKLPRVSGLEVLQRLRSESRTRLLPIVVLTSSFEDRDVASAYDNGANSYVRKPIEPGRFEEAARDLGMYWLLRNEVPRV